MSVENIQDMDQVTKDMHIPFDVMADFVFSGGRTDDFLKKAAVINKHVMECSECYKMHSALLQLRDSAKAYADSNTNKEKLFFRIMGALFEAEANISIGKLLEECRHFRRWLSFSIKSMRELVINQASEFDTFSYPRLATVMKSANGSDGVAGTESIIKSSLFDKNRNRVSIGLDGTLSLYFDSKEHREGKKVIILPDNDPSDEAADPQVIELTRYDDSISYVRVEGIKPGQYTIVVEE